MPLTKVVALARAWYRSYLDLAWRKWTLAEAQEIFGRLGLRGDVWRVPVGQSPF